MTFQHLSGRTDLEAYKRKRYGASRLIPGSVAHFPAASSRVLTFDLDVLSDGDGLPRQVEVVRRVEQAGTVDGLCTFFRVIFDDDTTLTNRRRPWRPRRTGGTACSDCRCVT